MAITRAGPEAPPRGGDPQPLACPARDAGGSITPSKGAMTNGSYIRISTHN